MSRTDIRQDGSSHVRAGALERVRGVLDGRGVAIVQDPQELLSPFLAHGEVLADDVLQRLAGPVVEAEEELDLRAVQGIAQERRS